MKWLQLAVFIILCYLASSDTRRNPAGTNAHTFCHKRYPATIDRVEHHGGELIRWLSWELRILGGATALSSTAEGIRTVFHHLPKRIPLLELPGAYANQQENVQKTNSPSRTPPEPSRPDPSNMQPSPLLGEQNDIDLTSAELRSVEENNSSATPNPAITPSQTATPTATPSPSSTRETFGESLNGCDCLSRCGTTFDTLVPWCEVDRSCNAAKYDGIRRQFWDQCALSPEDKDFYNTFTAAWSTMVTSAIIASSSVYFLAGIQAWRASFRSVSLRSLLWLPIVYALYGAATSLVFSSLMSLLIVQMYLAMPYAIPVSAAYALGAAQGCFLMYSQLDRWYSTSKA